MARIKVRDQYAAEHWIDEGQLAYEPWRSYEVLGRESDEPEGETPAESAPVEAGASKSSSKAASRPAPKVEE